MAKPPSVRVQTFNSGVKGFGEIMQKLAGKMKLSPEKYSLGREYKYARTQSSGRICKSEKKDSEMLLTSWLAGSQRASKFDVLTTKAV